MSDTSTLGLNRITKLFGSVQTVADVDFDVRDGKVMGLVVDNGGESTFSKCVAGIHRCDEGQIFFEGERVHVSGRKEAARSAEPLSKAESDR